MQGKKTAIYGTREGSSAERSSPGFGLMVAAGDVKVKVIIEVLRKVNVGVRLK